MMDKDIDRVRKLRYEKVPAAVRRAMNELYSQENNGKTMDEAKDYKRVFEYEAKVQRFR
jgi:hypothetical protein